MQFLDLIQALNFYHRLTQSHSLEFAKKESLNLIHWIILSDHCSIHLRPWNHNQLTRFSSQDSSGITTLWACVYRLCVFLGVCTPWTCVSSFALYSWLLMASSTPYPDRYTFFPLDFCRRRRKIRKDGTSHAYNCVTHRKRLIAIYCICKQIKRHSYANLMTKQNKKNFLCKKLCERSCVPTCKKNKSHSHYKCMCLLTIFHVQTTSLLST